ncbi:MAG: ribulose-phosphate 3-epimerase [bacterium]|nr:ribulose-phosphate 3-epimerase [bacterium]
MTVLAASLLAADSSWLGEAVRQADAAGVDAFHIDAMDGHFAPNIAFGPTTVKDLRALTTREFDVHLMLSHPDRFLRRYAEAGANVLTVHVEACTHVHRVLGEIRELGLQCGVALNPATPLSTLEWILQGIDRVLVMSVNPGFPGQSHISAMTQKVASLARLRDELGARFRISVDGGVGPANAAELVAAGCGILVCGSSIFGTGNLHAAVEAVRQAARG